MSTCEEPRPECLVRLSNMEAQVEEVKSGVVAIRGAVFGNGDPANSLLVRQAGVERAVRSIDRRHARQSKMMWGILVAVLSLLGGAIKDVAVHALTKEKTDERTKTARVADAVPAGGVPADGM